jgi:RND family efflux transporter MFP subunit
MLDASGFVVARRKATVSAKATGRLQQLFIEVGQRVEEGAIIAKLDDSNARASVQQSEAGVIQSTAALAAARAAAEDIGPIYDSNRKQAAAGLISAQALQTSKSAYDAAQAAVVVAEGNLAMARGALTVAQRAEDDTTVRAPFSGVIVDKAAQPGEIVSPVSAAGGFTRAGIGTLVDMSSLEVEVNVDESFIGRIHPQQPASVKLNAYPDWEIPARVSAVVPTADRNKGTVAVRIGFKTVDPRILPDMAAQVSFLPEQSPTTPGTTAN